MVLRVEPAVVVPRRRSGPPRSRQALAQPGVHLCPGIDCSEVVSPGMLACRAHWLRIPLPDRRLLGDAFRQRLTNPDLYELAVQTALNLLAAHDPKRIRR